MGLIQGDIKGNDNMEDIIAKIAEVLISTGVFTRAEFEKIPTNLLFYNGILKELQEEGFKPGSLGSILSEDDGSGGELRGYTELPALDDMGWAKLYPVAEAKVESLVFRRGSAELSDVSKRSLEGLASWLKRMPDYYIIVVGHARAAGDLAINKALSENRANASFEYLVSSCGVSKNRIKVKVMEPSDNTGESQSVTFELFERPY